MTKILWLSPRACGLILDVNKFDFQNLFEGTINSQSRDRQTETDRQKQTERISVVAYVEANKR